MGNGALAIGPKLPRPSSTLPTRHSVEAWELATVGLYLGFMRIRYIYRRPFKRASWWTKTFYANLRSVSGRSMPGSDWGLSEITKLRYLVRASHSFTLKTHLGPSGSFEMF